MFLKIAFIKKSLNVNEPLPSLTVSGGNLTFNGTVTNLTFSGGSLGGTNTVLGTMDWTGGTIANAAAVTVDTGAVLNLGGSAMVSLYGVLTNAGTVNWTGTGNLLVYNDGAGFNGGIYNLAGALFSIQNDQYLSGGYAYPFFNNAGTVRKSGATGLTTLNIPFNNSGTLDVQSGTVSLGTGGVLGGSATVAAGAQLNFAGGSFTLGGFSATGVPGSQ